MLRLVYFEGDELITMIFNTRAKCWGYIWDNNIKEYWLNGVYHLEV